MTMANRAVACLKPPDLGARSKQTAQALVADSSRRVLNTAEPHANAGHQVGPSTAEDDS